MFQINSYASYPPRVLAGLAESSSRPDFTISGFPEYATDLDPAQRALLRDAAVAIARSQETFNPVVNAVIIGHADKALRKEIGERAGFELEVSQKRAKTARSGLIQALITEAWGANYAQTFRTVALGRGNTEPIFLNAANEIEMRQNRRVEIYLAAATYVPGSCSLGVM